MGPPLVHTDLVHQAAAPFPDLETKAEWATHVTVTDHLGSTASSVLHHLTRRITSRSGSNMNLYEIAAGAGAKERATRDALAALISRGHILTRRQQNKPTIHFLPVDRILNTSSWYPRADLGFTRDSLKRRGAPATPPQTAEFAPQHTENNRGAKSAPPFPAIDPESAESAPRNPTTDAETAESAPPHGEIRRHINISPSPQPVDIPDQETHDLLKSFSNPHPEYPRCADSAPKEPEPSSVHSAPPATQGPETSRQSGLERADSTPLQLQHEGAPSAPPTPDVLAHFPWGAESALVAPPDQFDEDYVRQALRLYRKLGIQGWTSDTAALKKYEKDYPKFLHDLRGWQKRQEEPSQQTAPKAAHHRDKYLNDYLKAKQRAATAAAPC